MMYRVVVMNKRNMLESLSFPTLAPALALYSRCAEYMHAYKLKRVYLYNPCNQRLMGQEVR